MRGAIVLLLGVLSVGCAAAQQPTPAPRPASSVSFTKPTPAARVTRCAAAPSTVYGDEVVQFEIEGEGTAQVEVVDQREQSVFRSSSPLPGKLSVPQLPSGDFTLRISQSNVSCQVTVNRELPRASSAGR